jgi:hypothetical protein
MSITDSLDSAAAALATLNASIVAERSALLASIPVEASIGDVTAGIIDNAYISPAHLVGSLRSGVSPSALVLALVFALGPVLDLRYPKITLPPSGNNFYVNSALGNDNNDGLYNEAGRAFATIQGAINNISARYLSFGTVNINVNAGVYAGFTFVPSFISTWNVVGSPGSPSSIIVNSLTPGVNAGRGVISYANTTVIVSGMTFNTYYENLGASGGNVTVHDVNLNGSTRTAALSSYAGGILYVYGTNSFSGSGNSLLAAGASGFMQVGYQDAANTVYCSFVISGTPAWSAACVVATSGSTINIVSAVTTFTGNATGPRYAANSNGVIIVFGAGPNYLPGDSAGGVVTGGVYA